MAISVTHECDIGDAEAHVRAGDLRGGRLKLPSQAEHLGRVTAPVAGWPVFARPVNQLVMGAAPTVTLTLGNWKQHVVAALQPPLLAGDCWEKGIRSVSPVADGGDRMRSLWWAMR